MNRLESLQPQRNRLEGLNRPPRFDEPDVRKMLETSRNLMVSPEQMEPYWESLKLESDLLGRVDPSDPFAVGRARAEDNRIGTIEQIIRMDAVDWTSRIPFSPTGALASADLMAAAHRLQKDVYEEEFRAEFEKAESPEGRMQRLPGKPKVIALPQERRQQDLRSIESFLLKQQEVAERGMTFGAKVFDGLSYMPAWMIEFALTGGMAKLGNQTAREIGLKTLQGYAKTKGGRAVLKAAGWTGAQITRSTLGMPHRLAEEIVERRVDRISLEEGKVVQVDPESWATSIWKGWASNLIEVASESAGEGIIKGGAWVGRNTLAKMPLGSRLYEGLRRAYIATHPKPGAADEFATRFFDAAKFDGLIAEMGEERLATVLHAIVGTEDFGLGPEAGPLARLKKGLEDDLKNLPVEAAVLAVPGGAKMALDARGRVRDAKTPPAEETVPGVPGEGQATGVGETPTVAAEAPAGEGGQPWEMTREEYIAPTLADAKDAVEGTQAVTETGEPVTVFHGTGEVFERFDSGFLGTGSGAPSAREGFFFAADKETAASYAKGETASVNAAYLYMENPLVHDFKGSKFRDETYKDLLVRAKAEGHDGAIFRNTYDGAEKTDIYVVFDAGQIHELPGDADHALEVAHAVDSGLPVPRRVLEQYRGIKWADEALAKLEAETPPVRPSEPREGEPAPEVGREGVPQTGEQPVTLQQVTEAVVNEQPEGLVARFEAERPDLAEVHRQFRTWSWGRLPLAIRRRLKALGEESIEQPVTEDTPFEDLPPAAKERFAIEHAVNQAFGIDTSEPTENEVRDQNTALAAQETADSLREYFGETPPADLPSPSMPDVDVPFIENLVAWWKLGKKQHKDMVRVFKYIQFRDDVAQSFPQYKPTYELQKAREIANQVMWQHLAEKTKPYFDLDDKRLAAVHEALVAVEQYPDNPALGKLINALDAEQRAAYVATREALDELGELLIAEMERLEVPQEQIDEMRARIGNYIPHKWYGNFRVVVKEPRARAKALGRPPQTIDMSGVSRWEAEQEKRRLQQSYPESAVFVVKETNLPYQAFQEATYAPVQSMVNLVIEQWKKQVGDLPGITENQADALEQAFKDLEKSKGFGMHFIKRAEVKGWTQDLRRPLAEYYAGIVGFLTKMEAMRKFPEALAEIDPAKTPNLYLMAVEDVKYWTGEQPHEMPKLRSGLYYAYLFLNLKSAAVNLTGNMVLGWPTLSRYTKQSMAKMLGAQADLAVGRITQGEKALLAQMEETGLLDPQLSQEISGFGGNPIYRSTVGKAKQALSWIDFFRAAESFNRRSMAVAIHRAGITDPARITEIVDEAHHRYSKGTRPSLFRGGFTPLMTFRSFTLHQLTWIKNQIKEGRIGPLARHMAAWTFIGGLKALPLAGLGALAYAQIFKSDPEEDMAEVIGETAAKIVMRGAPTAAGVTLSGSVGMHDLVPVVEPGQDVFKAYAEWAGGVLADVPARVSRVTKDIQVGDYASALEDMSPEFLRNPLAAWRQYSQGARYRSTQPVLDLDGKGQFHLSEMEAVMKAMGFQPERLSRAYEKGRILMAIGAERQANKRVWGQRFHLGLINGDTETRKEVLQELTEYNRRMLSRKAPEQVIPPGELLQYVKTLMRPGNMPARRELMTYMRAFGIKEESK
jgi:hypothetical protein